MNFWLNLPHHTNLTADRNKPCYYACIVCHNKILHQQYAVCSGSPHNDGSFYQYMRTVELAHQSLLQYGAYHAVPSVPCNMRMKQSAKVDMLGAYHGTYYTVSTCPMMNGISMLEARYFVGRTILYQPVPWYIRMGWTVGLACQKPGTLWDVPFCTNPSHGTLGHDGQ